MNLWLNLWRNSNSALPRMFPRVNSNLFPLMFSRLSLPKILKQRWFRFDPLFYWRWYFFLKRIFWSIVLKLRVKVHRKIKIDLLGYSAEILSPPTLFRFIFVPRTHWFQRVQILSWRHSFLQMNIRVYRICFWYVLVFFFPDRMFYIAI